MFSRHCPARPHALVRMMNLCALTLAISWQPASGQLLKRIKEKVVQHTVEKVTEHSAKAESTVVKATDKATDSAFTKTDRGVDATMRKAGAAVDSGLNKTERGIQALFAGRTTSRDSLVAALSAGRVRLRDIAFRAGTAELLESSDEMLRHLATALRSADGPFLLEGHVDATSDDAADRKLSEERASAVKRRLISLGVGESRLFAMGLGATQQTGGASPSASNGRIEIARMR